MVHDDLERSAKDMLLDAQDRANAQRDALACLCELTAQCPPTATISTGSLSSMLALLVDDG